TGKVEKSTKTKKSRPLALGPVVIAALRTHRQRCIERCNLCGVELPDDAFVFSPDVDGIEPLAPRSISQRFNRFYEKLKQDRHVRIYDLRHYTITQLLVTGMDLATVQQRAGPARGSRMTLGRYGHAVEKANERAASVIEAVM